MFIATLPLLAAPAYGRVSAQDVCSFITNKIRLVTPEIPTMCTPTATSPAYKLSVFSTTDVLQGKIRRTWSVAVFEAAQQLFFGNALKGACQSPSPPEGGPICQLNISDAYMSQHGQYYPIMPSSSLKDELYGDPSSDQWYEMWWYIAMVNASFYQFPGSKQNAESLGRSSCDRYLAAVKSDPLISTAPNYMPVPNCSVLLATDSSLDLVIDFPDFFTPSFVNYKVPLADVFGAAFVNTPYRGSVIFRSPWKAFNEGSVSRCLWSYDLRELEFYWEESHSGVRDPNETLIKVLGSSRRGQTERNSFSEGQGGGDILRITTVEDGRELIGLTGGSEWYVQPAEAAKCAHQVGDEVTILYIKRQARLLSGGCAFEAAFSGAGP